MKPIRYAIPILLAVLMLLCAGCQTAGEGYRASEKLALSEGGEVWLERERSTGFYEPGESITCSLVIKGKSPAGKTLTAELLDGDGRSLASEEISPPSGGGTKRAEISFPPQEKNGEYRVRVTSPEGELEMGLGVIKAAETAGKDFYFGVQPYLVRGYMWEGFNQTDLSGEDFTEAMLDAIGYMGCNVIREDMPWEAIQPSKSAKFDFSLTDKITKQAEDRGILYNWLLNGCPGWAASEKALEIEKITGQALWQSAPESEAWQNYISALAEHYKGQEILWEIWNEPDWEFFAGDEDDYLALLRTAGNTFKKADPGSFVYAGGLAFSAGDAPAYSYAKDRTKLYRGYRELLDESLIDAFAYHIHGYFNSTGFSAPMEELKADLQKAGLTGEKIFNTECGCADEVTSYMAATDMAKALWSRGHGDGMFILFSFTDIMEDGTKWHAFDDYLSPNAAAVAYTNLISLLGNSSLRGALSDGEGLYADLYFDGENTVIPVYGITDARHSQRLILPEGAQAEVLDLYGNRVEKESYSAEIAPYYIVLKGEYLPEDFQIRIP